MNTWQWLTSGFILFVAIVAWYLDEYYIDSSLREGDNEIRLIVEEITGRRN